MDYEHNRKEFNSDTIELWNEISTNAIQKWMARNPISSKGENMNIYNIVFFTSKKMFSLSKKQQQQQQPGLPLQARNLRGSFS